MDAVNANLRVQAGLYAFDKAKEVKNEQVLSAFGMTPETERAQKEIDASMKEEVAKATGRGVNFDAKA